jgi:hypothetical protein
MVVTMLEMHFFTILSITVLNYIFEQGCPQH